MAGFLTLRGADAEEAGHRFTSPLTEIFGSGVLAAIRREGGDFSFQVTGVRLGKRSLEQLLNNGDKVVEVNRFLQTPADSLVPSR